MRLAFTILAVLLIAVLSVALAAPYFIDWTGQRKQIETHLSRILGSQVAVSGPIDLKLLPIPYLSLANVHIAEGDKAAASLDIDSVRLEMALSALVRGQFRFTQASFEHPVLTTTRGPDGSFSFPRFDAKARSEQIALEKIIVRDGRIDIASATGPAAAAITRIDVDAQADSLRGPFKGAGAANGVATSRLSFHFATGVAANNALSVKGFVETQGSAVRGEFDGALSSASSRSNGGTVALSYQGAASLSGSIDLGEDGAQLPWRASGVAQADARGAKLSTLEVRLGEEERALIATGSAKADFGARPELNLVLESKKLDLDALLRRPGESSVAPRRALEIIRRLAVRGGVGEDAPLALSFELTSPSAILGGDAIADVALEANAGPKTPIAGRLECAPPGRSHLIASGVVELGAATGFKGRVDAEVGDAQPLRDWLTQDAEPFRASLSALGEMLPYRSLALGGNVDVSEAGFAARDLRLALDQSVFNGAIAWTSALGAERSRLFMDLRTDELDLASLPNVGAGNAYFRDSDLAVSVEANALRVEHVGETNLSGGRLALKLTKTGENLAMDRLSITGLGGANVEAKGGADANGAWLDGSLGAAQARDFALLVRRLFPGEASDILFDRSGALSPANLTFKAQFSPDESASNLEPVSLTLAGNAGSTHVDAKLGRRAADSTTLDATITLDAPDAAPLLRQLGAPAQSLAGKGRGQFALTAHGRMAEGFDAEAKAALAGVDMTWRGRLQPNGDEGRPMAFGAGGLKTANAGPLLSVLGYAAPSLSLVIPAALDADVVWRGGMLRLTNLKGGIGGAKLSGALSWTPPASEAAPTILDPDIALAKALAGESASERAAQIEGQLTMDRLPVSALTALALGPSQPPEPGALWSNAAFAPGLARAPTTDVKLNLARLDLTDALQAQNVVGRIGIDPSAIKFDDLSMTLRGGALTGRVSMRRAGANAALSGQVEFDSIPFDSPGVAGRVSGSLDFAGSGQSAANLVGNLAGQGQIQLAGVRAAHLDPGALGRIVDKAQAPDYPIDQTNVEHALAIELDKQALAPPDSSIPASLTNGVLRVSPVDAQAAKSRASLSATIDLKTMTSALHAAFSELQTTKFWSGPPPSVSVDVTSAFDAPVREIDSSSFAAGLAQQAIARESDRIAALEADLRERAYFNRRLKAEQFMRRREQELAAYALEQARLKSEQDRKRVEDSAQKAYDDAQKAVEEARRAEEAKKAEDARKAAEEARRAEEAKKAEDAQKAAEEARRAEEAKKAEDARKAAEEARKAEEAKKAEDARKAAADAAAAIAPQLPDEVPAPVFNVAPAPPPPPKPRVPITQAPDPTAGGLY